MRKTMWILLAVILALTLGIVLFLNQRSFGRLPSGERLQRVLSSPNYRDGQFRNLSVTPQLVSDKGRARLMLDFLFRKVEALRPKNALPVVKTDLRGFAPDEEVAVWFGHSSLFVQTGGKRLLVDPVFVMASPVSFFNKPFRGTDLYTPDDMPDIDYLVISHDHWDHLDYGTVLSLKDRTTKIICPLGVGEHFERWGFDPARIVELDWNQSAPLDEGFAVHCLPARHFSGRGPKPNQTLWASFLLQTPSRNLYFSGDGGYDTHFAQIASRFGPIDLAVLENGQYNEDWRYIHMLPADVVKAAKDLQPRLLLTGHNSKYALAKHPWREPLEKIAAGAADSLHLATPRIGEPVLLDDTTQTFGAWWVND